MQLTTDKNYLNLLLRSITSAKEKKKKPEVKQSILKVFFFLLTQNCKELTP